MRGFPARIQVPLLFPCESFELLDVWIDAFSCKVCVEMNACALSEVGSLFHQSELDPRAELCAQLASTLTKLTLCVFALASSRDNPAANETARAEWEAQAESECARLARLFSSTRLLLGLERALRFLRAQRPPRCVSLAPACRVHVPEGNALERVGATLEAGLGRLRVFLARDPQAATQLVLEPYESARLGVKFRLWLLALGPPPSADYEYSYSACRLSRLDLSRRSRLLTQLCAENLRLPLATASASASTSAANPLGKALSLPTRTDKDTLSKQLFLISNWPAFLAISSLIAEVEERLLMNSLHLEVSFFGIEKNSF